MRPFLLVCVLLGACSTTNVAQTEIALTAAEQSAFIYASLPRCPAPNPCSKQATVDAIKAADAIAYQAVKAAQSGSAVAEANAAVAALVALIPLI